MTDSLVDNQTIVQYTDIKIPAEREETRMDRLPTDNAFFKQFIRNLAQFFEGKGEIAVHDFCDGFDHTVVDIVGSLSGRQVGDNSSDSFIDAVMNRPESIDSSPVYFGRSEKGTIRKTCSTLIRDETGAVIGAVCLNYDVTDLILAHNAINQCVRYWPEESSVEEATKAMDVDSLMQHYISMAEARAGKPLQLMNKEEKIQALAYLDGKGVFKIHKAGVILCDAFQISKYTLYSYLDEAKQQVPQA